MKNSTNNNKTLAQHIDNYLTHLEMRNNAPATIDTARFRFGKFLDWAEIRSLEAAEEVTLQKLQNFQKYLKRYKKRNGETIIMETQHAIFSTLKRFFEWMRRQGHLAVDPAENMDLPKLSPKALPNKGLSTEEVAKLFKTPNVKTKLGLRNRAMLAVFYSTGVRRSELCTIDLQDIDFKEQSVRIMGKGGKERYVIIGETACEWLQKYLDDARPELDRGAGGDALFLNKNGVRMAKGGLSHTMSDIFKCAGLDKKGSTHLWRHTFCTQLVASGCGLRVVQKLMGHASLDYIARYSSLDLSDLKKAMKEHHKAA